MPPDPQQFVPLKNVFSQSSPFLWLFFLSVPTSPPTAFRWAANPREVAFDTNSNGQPLIWRPAAIQVSGLEQSSDGSLPQLRVSVSNVQGTLMKLMKAHRWLIDSDLVITVVHRQLLNDPTARIEYPGKVTKADIDDRAATFSVSSENLYGIKVPNLVIDDETCGRRYGDLGCGFQIAIHDPDLSILGPCALTRQACRLRGDLEVANGYPRLHPRRFFAFPGAQ